MSEKIKVLHIIKSLGRGGAEMLLPETLELHNKNRFEFHYVYFLPWKDQMVAAISKLGGNVRCFDSTNNVELVFKAKTIVKYVKDNDIELIHAHLPWAGILARIVGRRTKFPVIYTEHNKQERYHWVTRFINQFTLNWQTTVIAVSKDVAESIYKNKPQIRVPVQTIVNGVNISKFKRESFKAVNIREKLNISSSALVVGTIAVFRSQKRLDLWMEIAAKIVKQIDNAHFIIVGDGPLKGELLRKRDELGLRARIHMPGLETDVRPYLATFNVYMMSSIFEGLPIAMLEAMAMCCPVVATDAGGIKEVIRHEIDGLLCPVDEPERLVELVCGLLMDSKKSLDIGTQGRIRVVESFSIAKMVTELEILYDGIIGMK